MRTSETQLLSTIGRENEHEVSEETAVLTTPASTVVDDAEEE
jgi:hypothetical protein